MTLTACGEPPLEPPPSVPAVRVHEVGKLATGQSRRISGVVSASNRTALAFGVGGRIVEILIVKGDTVNEAQVLASLDPEPFDLAVEQARGELGSARAQFDEAKANFSRIKPLVEQKARSMGDLESARASLGAAANAVKVVQAALDSTLLDRKRSRVVAPFAGRVVEIVADPFQEIASTADVIILQADGALSIDVLLPETLVRDVEYGQAVQATFPSLENVVAVGTVASIGAEASTGNAYPLTVQLDMLEGELRAGMTANVTFNFTSYLDGRTSFLVPISAIALEGEIASYRGSEDDAGTRAPVFILDAERGELERRVVVVGDLRGNEVEVFDGLEAGDLLVTAGVTFLRNGMRARVWTPRR